VAVLIKRSLIGYNQKQVDQWIEYSKSNYQAKLDNCAIELDRIKCENEELSRLISALRTTPNIPFESIFEKANIRGRLITDKGRENLAPYESDEQTLGEQTLNLKIEFLSLLELFEGINNSLPETLMLGESIPADNDLDKEKSNRAITSHNLTRLRRPPEKNKYLVSQAGRLKKAKQQDTIPFQVEENELCSTIEGGTPCVAGGQVMVDTKFALETAGIAASVERLVAPLDLVIFSHLDRGSIFVIATLISVATILFIDKLVLGLNIWSPLVLIALFFSKELLTLAEQSAKNPARGALFKSVNNGLNIIIVPLLVITTLFVLTSVLEEIHINLQKNQSGR